MADITLLTFTSTGSAKGLVLGNKQGFYRDLGADIFNNNDFVRMAIYYSLNLTAAPNTSPPNNVSQDLVTNTLPSDYFYCGFKSPNANFPDAAQAQSKFCGLYMPPRGYDLPSATTRFLGYNGATYSTFGSTFANVGSMLICGDLTTPYTNAHILSTAGSVLSKVTHSAKCGTANSLSVMALEFRSDNTLLADVTTPADGQEPYCSTPALSTMSNYINNRPFSSNSVSLASSAPYGQATAIFMYNPLNTVCIRVHGIAAAGFSY